ncbi:MAG: AAA family ATPase [Chlamydiales bacterium]|nr:AAA family ATPase [Chlamydiales bacterium]
MITRILEIIKNHSSFLFGPRGVGKSTLIKHIFQENFSIIFNLLKTELRERFLKNPDELAQIVKALPNHITHVVIDEIQKAPKLLDVVHDLIESTNKHFIMTGSSARKLKSGGANLLAGRAFVYNLHPFCFLEVEEKFQLENALHWGMLPKIFEYPNDEMKRHYLQAYAHTYLKEEIWEEHFIKDLEPFRRFLEIAAQMNGKIINYANIARDVGADDKTIKSYYTILEDTLLGLFLEGFEHSFRKRLVTKPKFYFFDTGVTRALARLLSVPLTPQTAAYGEAFEHFIILEIIKLRDAYHSEYRFSYLKTKDDNEIDLVVERPGKPILFIEIKSTTNVTKELISSFVHLTRDFGPCEAVCFSDDPLEKMIEHIRILPWNVGIKRYFSHHLTS